MRIALFLLVAGGLSIYLLWSGTVAPDVSRTPDIPVESVGPQQLGEILRTPAELALRNTSEGSLRSLPAWKQCLLLEDERFQDCFLAHAPENLTPAEVAWVLNLVGTRSPVALHVLHYALEKTPPDRLLLFVDAVCLEYKDPQALQMSLEAVVAQLCKENETWAIEVASFVTPQALFNMNVSHGPIFVAGSLMTVDSRIAPMLEEGSRGEWGGTDLQVGTALGTALAVYDNSQCPDSGFTFLASVVDAPTRPASRIFCMKLVTFLTARQFFPDGNSNLNCDLVMEILADPAMRASAAEMLHRLYGGRVPDGVPENNWLRIRREVELALGK